MSVRIFLVFYYRWNEVLAAKGKFARKSIFLTVKRDLELVRSILLDVEASEPGELLTRFEYDGKSKAEVLEHLSLLVEAGYLDGKVMAGSKGIPLQAIIHKLTWPGHEFLANAKNDKVWRQVMTDVGKTTTAVSMEILKVLLSKATERLFTP